MKEALPKGGAFLFSGRLFFINASAIIRHPDGGPQPKKLATFDDHNSKYVVKLLL